MNAQTRSDRPELTPQMIQAGVREYFRWNPEEDLAVEIVVAVYQAMSSPDLSPHKEIERA